jgi:hypothetical protein
VTRVAAVLLVLASACAAHVGPTLRSELRADVGSFVFEYGAADRQSLEQLEAAVHSASARLAQWGGLTEPVTVYVLPSHRALEDAVNRPGHSWLKAWARYDEVFVQSPRTWSLFGAGQREVDELMLHELTHSLMYQQASDRTHWRRKGIAPWFREGMASFVAEQGSRWSSPEDLSRFYGEHPSAPVGDPDALTSSIAYGGAHHAFTFLVRRRGVEGVRALLAAMKNGRSFDEAFAETVGVPQSVFLDEFRRELRLRQSTSSKAGFASVRLALRRLRPSAEHGGGAFQQRRAILPFHRALKLDFLKERGRRDRGDRHAAALRAAEAVEHARSLAGGHHLVD